jgi:flagellar FliJ protein
MATFRYKMQNILDLKEKLETQAKTEFAEQSAKLREEELKLSRIYDDIKVYEEKIRSMNEQKLDILELKQCNNGIKIKKQQAKAQKRNIALAQKNLDIARGKLNQVMVDRKTQEILKDKAFEEFKRELEVAESKEVDEVVSFKYNKFE